jgi:gp16 family phage-associated protein
MVDVVEKFHHHSFCSVLFCSVREQSAMTKTRRKVRAEFVARGESIAEWARAHGYHQRTVHSVIDGRLKATRGVSHRIAVELGLKPDPEALKQAA